MFAALCHNEHKREVRRQSDQIIKMAYVVKTGVCYIVCVYIFLLYSAVTLPPTFWPSNTHSLDFVTEQEESNFEGVMAALGMAISLCQ